MFICVLVLFVKISATAPPQESTRAKLERLLSSAPTALAAVSHRLKAEPPSEMRGCSELALPPSFKSACGAFEDLCDINCRLTAAESTPALRHEFETRPENIRGFLVRVLKEVFQLRVFYVTRLTWIMALLCGETSDEFLGLLREEEQWVRRLIAANIFILRDCGKQSISLYLAVAEKCAASREAIIEWVSETLKASWGGFKMPEWAPLLRVRQLAVLLEALEIRLHEEVRWETEMGEIQIACIRCLSVRATPGRNCRKKMAETGRILIEQKRLSQEFLASKQKAEIFRDMVNRILESTIPLFVETSVSSPEVTRAWHEFCRAQKTEETLAGPLEKDAGAIGKGGRCAIPQLRQLIESVEVWRDAFLKSHANLKLAVGALVDSLTI